MGSTDTCASCGGPLGSEPVCAFCGAKVSRAPKVIERVVERVVFVEHGAGGSTSLSCPRCKVPLFQGKTETTSVFGCGACGGIWLDNAASQRLVSAIDGGIVSLGAKATRAARVSPELTASVACPVCAEALARKVFVGVELDVCAAHGTWFDRNEVERVARGIVASQNAIAGGATHDYEADARANQGGAYGKGAVVLLGLLVEGLAAAGRS